MCSAVECPLYDLHAIEALCHLVVTVILKLMLKKTQCRFIKVTSRKCNDVHTVNVLSNS